MSYGYFKNGMKDKEAVFNLFYRKNPFDGNYAVACGLHSAIEFIENFKFTQSDIDYLATLKGNNDLPLFDNDFLEYLLNLKFTGEIEAIEEGRIVFPHEPLMKIKAPIILGQILETPLLNIINFQTLIATKTNRICHSAQGDPVLEFGLRRAQGIDGALSATYASAVGGAHSTSNVLAGKLFGIPVKGTHAHSWVMSYPDETEAFEIYAKHMPNNCVFLVDTYDTLNGVKKAIKVGEKLKANNHKMVGIRLDSGDLAELSKQSRLLLDEAGFNDAKIFASNDLDESTIKELKIKGAKIDIWGVGTKLVTAYNQPALGGVYKLSAIKNSSEKWDYKVKKSEELIKVSNPGILQVNRFKKEGKYCFDVITNEEFLSLKKFVPFNTTEAKEIESGLECEKLLVPIFNKGKLVYKIPSISESNLKRIKDLKSLDSTITENERSSNPYQVGLESELFELKKALLNKI